MVLSGGILSCDKEGRIRPAADLDRPGLCADLWQGPLCPSGGPDPADVTFLGIPLPEAEAETVFSGLAGRGFTAVRLPVTWEALEHGGAGVYDESYIAYLRRIINIAGKNALKVVISIRLRNCFTGGEGAPAWTLEAAGGVDDKDAAFMEGLFMGEASAGGEMLRRHFIAAYRHCFRRLKNCGALAGWELRDISGNAENYQSFIKAFIEAMEETKRAVVYYLGGDINDER